VDFSLKIQHLSFLHAEHGLASATKHAETFMSPPRNWAFSSADMDCKGIIDENVYDSFRWAFSARPPLSHASHSILGSQRVLALGTAAAAAAARRHQLVFASRLGMMHRGQVNFLRMLF